VGIDADLGRELSARGWWFDTSAISPEETARKIIAEATTRAVDAMGSGGRVMA
jgi:hypothetical protein